MAIWALYWPVVLPLQGHTWGGSPSHQPVGSAFTIVSLLFISLPSSGILLPSAPSSQEPLSFLSKVFFQSKHYSRLLTCTVLCTNPSFRHTHTLWYPQQEILNTLFTTTLFQQFFLASFWTMIIPPSCIYSTSTNSLCSPFHSASLCTAI